jgi:hypothetical protein
MKICGTNVRSGIPTLAGFPLKDGTVGTDARYTKMLYRGGGNTQPNNAYLWVTSEMVVQWYHQINGQGGPATAGNTGNTASFGRHGDANDWVTCGYGDLSYSLNIKTW